MGAAAAVSVWSTGAGADSHQICYSRILDIMMLKIAELLKMPSGEGSLLHTCMFFALITQNKLYWLGKQGKGLEAITQATPEPNSPS